MLVHGTENGYSHYKCRCNLCRSANTKAYLKWKKSIYGTIPKIHGTTSYSTYGCRCEICSVAHAKYRKNYNKKVKLNNQNYNFTHGASGYSNYGCRCEICTKSWATLIKNRAKKLVDNRGNCQHEKWYYHSSNRQICANCRITRKIVNETNL